MTADTRNYMGVALMGMGLGYLASRQPTRYGHREVRLVRRRLEPTPHRDMDRPMGHRAIEVDPEADYVTPQGVPVDRRMRQERRFPLAGAAARLPYRRRRRMRRGGRDAEQMINWYESSMNDNC
jgi:hypothetical protein